MPPRHGWFPGASKFKHRTSEIEDEGTRHPGSGLQVHPRRYRPPRPGERFIGANGSGKSNLLEAIGTLSAAAAGRVDDEAIIRRGVRAGLPRLFKTSFSATRIPPYRSWSQRLGCRIYGDAAEPTRRARTRVDFKSEALESNGAVHIKRGPRNKAARNIDDTAGLAALKRVGDGSG